MRVRCALIVAIASSAFTMSAAADDKIPLKLLFVGESKSDRAKDFAHFLDSRFASVKVVDREHFDPASAASADVVLLDWSQRSVNIMNMQELKSPLGPRESWSKPLVLLGSAGLLIASPWQTAGSYG